MSWLFYFLAFIAGELYRGPFGFSHVLSAVIAIEVVINRDQLTPLLGFFIPTSMGIADDVIAFAFGALRLFRFLFLIVHGQYISY
jgi:hypothetical protein